MSVDRIGLDLNIFSSCLGLCMLKLQLAAVEELLQHRRGSLESCR